MGEFFALLAAIIWSNAVILLKKSGESVSPLSLNLFRVGVTVPLLVLTLMVVRQPVRYEAPLIDYLILFASGIIAIAISDTLFHKSLNMVGAGISAIVGCLYSPSVVVLAFLLIGERFTGLQLGGMGLIIAGVVVAAGHKPPEGTATRQIVIGVVLGALSLVAVALGIVIAKPVLNRSPVVWATAMRQIGALAALLPIALISSRRRQILLAFKPSSTWKYTIPATLLGSYVALMAWIAGMKYTLAGIAAILNQTSTIFILLFATVFLKEAVTRRKVAAAALAVGGILLVTYAS
ncbi:MAG: DMT family transporter [bacterium]|jgi:drug/metabolite transporter (DMT)-like permease